jgi:uncharacterized protein YeaO (DUF488 family)
MIVQAVMPVVIKRVYEPPSPEDGARVLVDRLWPRGLTKARAAIDEWLRDLAPSDDLRRWYHTRPSDWPAFRIKYLKELSQPQVQESLQQIYQLVHKRKRITLLFASRNETQNNATVLKELLEGRRKPPTGTGPSGATVVRHRRGAIRRK